MQKILLKRKTNYFSFSKRSFGCVLIKKLKEKINLIDHRQDRYSVYRTKEDKKKMQILKEIKLIG